MATTRPALAVTLRMGHPGTVNAQHPVRVIEVQVRADGRRYPSPMPDRAESNRCRWLEHQLICQGGMSYRQAQQALLQEGTKRSLGIIARDLANFQCPACAEPPDS